MNAGVYLRELSWTASGSWSHLLFHLNLSTICFAKADPDWLNASGKITFAKCSCNALVELMPSYLSLFIYTAKAYRNGINEAGETLQASVHMTRFMSTSADSSDYYTRRDCITECLTINNAIYVLLYGNDRIFIVNCFF